MKEKKRGIEYFMTTKLAWNQIDKMPYDTFMWKRIDGSSALTLTECTRR